MYLNVSTWETFSTAANDAAESHATQPQTAGLVEGVSGAAVGLLLLIGIMIAVRKNLETVQGVLEQLRILLMVAVNAIRKWIPTANPPPSSNESGHRNYTDDQIIEMRRQMDDHINDQEDYGASSSVWI